ncbi:DedA family protein [Actinoplanes sp. NPDC049265]|uniref:DedA family protein n=1 Tax=Actinoplanes sp. NPDC049265 TaxID=3363902 RepID=UPI0037102034
MDFRALDEYVALNPLDPKDLLQTFGLYGVWAILFAETGLLVGFFFPGDSLLFLAGIAASPVADAIFGAGTKISIVGLLIGAPAFAVAGAQFGHFLGKRYGRKMFERPDSRLFKREYVEKAEYYFEKFGPAKAVVLARFIPIVRTFLNPVAGTLGMPARQFLLWNIVGAVLWADGILLIGYLLADSIYKAIGDHIDRYILPVVALIVLISVLPIAIEMIRERKAKQRKAAEGAGEDADAGPATAIGVVAAATVAGIADAIQDEFEEHRPHQHDQSYQPEQSYPGQPYPDQPYQSPDPHRPENPARGQVYGGGHQQDQRYDGNPPDQPFAPPTGTGYDGYPQDQRYDGHSRDDQRYGR